MYMAMQLYIIRHGQSTNNVSMARDPDDRVVDAPLTELGRKQAECLAHHLKTAPNLDTVIEKQYGFPLITPEVGIGLTHLYCSPMQRALQTAQPVAKALGLIPQVWVEIHEHGGQHLKVNGIPTGFPGKTRAELLSEFPDYVLQDDFREEGWWRVENGEEDIIGCFSRAIRVAHKLHQRAGQNREDGVSERIAMITHGTFIDALIKALFNQLPASPANMLYYTHYNTGITRIDFMPSGYPRFRYLNRVDHLSAELIS